MDKQTQQSKACFVCSAILLPMSRLPRFALLSGGSGNAALLHPYSPRGKVSSFQPGHTMAVSQTRHISRQKKKYDNFLCKEYPQVLKLKMYTVVLLKGILQ